MGRMIGEDQALPTGPGRAEPQASATTLGFWLRWLAVLPAAAVVVPAVSFPIHWAVLIFTNTNNDEEGGLPGLWDLPPETLERLGQAFFAPLAFVYIGAKVAPAFKLHTAVVLMMLWAIGMGAALMYAGMIGAYEAWAWAEFAAVGVLGAAGLLAGGYSIYSAQRE
jgi:hypothetical protein